MSYVVRVELHDAEDKYEKLHEEMGNRGFTRTHQDRQGIHRLPSGSYIFNGDLNAPMVRLHAEAAAVAAQAPDCSILVSEGPILTHNLKER
jgi:hypothetical protein